MLNRGRIVALVLACLVVIGTLFQAYRFDERLKIEKALEDTVTQQLSATDYALADVRQAQAAYVAAGQGTAFWMNHFDEALARVDATLRERQQVTQSNGALPHYDAALEQVDALRTSDLRARNYIGGDQLLLASDVIFVESLEIIGRISANVSAARDTEVFAARQAQVTITRYQQGLVAGGFLVTLMLAVLASRRPRSRATEDAPVTLDLADLAQQPASPAPPVHAEPLPALDETADVCVDLARLLDGRDLPALLGRAADAIGAKGLVLWVVDESGQTLRASLAHGYPERMLARLGQLPVSGDNVTSLACRTLQPQQVQGATPDNSGALAVPLVSTTGCVGVLSAEVTGARTTDHQVSIARLIAAQLSAVIRPDAAAAASVAGQ